MCLEFHCILVKDNILESNFLRDFGLKKNRDHLIDGLCRNCVRLNEVELHKEGALRIFEDVEISEIIETLRQLVSWVIVLDGLFI